MTSLSISLHMVFHSSVFDCLLNLCASRLPVVYASLLSGVRLFTHNLKHLCLYLTFDFSSSFHHAVCFFLLTDVHFRFKSRRIFNAVVYISVQTSPVFFNIFVLGSGFPVFPGNLFLKVLSHVFPICRLCELTRFFFSAGFSFLMVCLVLQ